MIVELSFLFLILQTYMKRLLLIVALCASCLLGLGAFLLAQEEQTFAEQKDLFMDEVYRNPEFISLIDIDQAKVTLIDLSKSFQQLSDQYSSWDEKKEELEDEYSDIQLTIEQIMHDMGSTRRLAITTLMKVNLFKKKISWLKKNITELDVSLKESKSNLVDYTTFLYKMNNDYYGQDLAINDIKLLVKSENIADSLSADHLVQMLTMKLTVLLDSIRREQVAHTRQIMELNKTKLEYQDSAKSLRRDMEELEQQKKYFYELLGYLQTSRDDANEKVGKLRLSKEELEHQMSMLQQATERSVSTTLHSGSAIFQLLHTKDRDDGDSYFSRPLVPVKDVMYYYHDPYYLQEYGRQHDWISLVADQWVEVYAPAPWVVYKVHNRDDIWLNWLMMIHKYGYITFYRPLSEIFVTEKQIIKRGQIIGRTWWQPWTRWAWLDSTIPYLAFDILKNGESIDPYTVMDISIFEEKEALPKEYRMKYLQDYFSRDVDLSDLPVVTGETMEERRDDFLRRYASGPYADPSLRYDGSTYTGIDPIFGMCIGFAETSYKHFKTKNNIWNVGNDDSGNTVEYLSPLAGVQALYNVLNNQYLGWYYTINELSRFGNTDGYIYASSPYNRQKNIMKCMSTIYGYPVPEDYPFRRWIEE